MPSYAQTAIECMKPSTYAYAAKAIDIIVLNYLFTISISAFVSFYYVRKHVITLIQNIASHLGVRCTGARIVGNT